MQIPRITQEFFPSVSGPANQALAIAHGLERRGVASPIFTTTPGEDQRTVGVAVRRFPPLLALANFRIAPALGRALLNEPATLLHIHGWRNPASNSAIYTARRRKLPFILQAHGIAFGHRYAADYWPTRVARNLADAVIRPFILCHAAAVVASTQHEASELRRYGFAKEQIVVIPAGVTSEFFAPIVRPEREEITILSVGRLAPRRNVEQIIQAIALLQRDGIRVQLRIVGPEVALAAGEAGGYRATLENLAYAYGVAQQVTFVGELQGAALRAEYHTADVFVCASRYENFGQPRAEAAATGLPVVLTPTGMAPELLEGNMAGVQFALDDAHALAAALRPLCKDYAMRQRLGQAAQALASALFDWERIVPRYVELYQQIGSYA